jgi:hypothetical protein
MNRAWNRHDQQAVIEGLRRGERPEMATTLASGPLDDSLGLRFGRTSEDRGLGASGRSGFGERQRSVGHPQPSRTGHGIRGFRSDRPAADGCLV